MMGHHFSIIAFQHFRKRQSSRIGPSSSRYPRPRPLAITYVASLHAGAFFDNEAPNTKANQAIQLDQQFKEQNINIVAATLRAIDDCNQIQIGQHQYKPIEKQNFFQHQGQQIAQSESS
ncbi:hypothetical protein Nepgr_022801 [Nepenthes gracilis]|uniref:Uncharacterized protein n=1 Tax=Nepenthes gracilis TaxID=150966 RepID=A0AAD3T1N8_NEPGR|nr:hypothetical protein Nepgr_022801 [Nepenthes gracilis]